MAATSNPTTDLQKGGFFRHLRSLRAFGPLRQRKDLNLLSSNTRRLYLALYSRLKDTQTYHYALHVSPQETSDQMICETTKFHSKNILQATGNTVVVTWIYEAVKVNPNRDDRILIRVLLAEDCIDQAESLFAEVPIRQNDPNFNCVAWVQQALLQYEAKTGVRLLFDWDTIQRTALEYVTEKKKRGRFDIGWKGDSSRVATFDMILGREVVT